MSLFPGICPEHLIVWSTSFVDVTSSTPRPGNKTFANLYENFKFLFSWQLRVACFRRTLLQADIHSRPRLGRVSAFFFAARWPLVVRPGHFTTVATVGPRMCSFKESFSRRAGGPQQCGASLRVFKSHLLLRMGLVACTQRRFSPEGLPAFFAVS